MIKANALDLFFLRVFKSLRYDLISSFHSSLEPSSMTILSSFPFLPKSFSSGLLMSGSFSFMSPLRNSPASSYVRAIYSAMFLVVFEYNSWLDVGKPTSYT